MSHDYDVFRAVSGTQGIDTEQDAEHQRVRTEFANRLAIMLDEAGQDYAAHLVRAERTDGGWP